MERGKIGPIMIAPILMGSLVFYILPFFLVIQLSFSQGYGRSRAFVGLLQYRKLFENSIEHMSETRVDKDEVRKQFRIRGWSEETRQVILAALEYYKCAEGLAKIRG